MDDCFSAMETIERASPEALKAVTGQSKEWWLDWTAKMRPTANYIRRSLGEPEE